MAYICYVIDKHRTCMSLHISRAWLSVSEAGGRGVPAGGASVCM